MERIVLVGETNVMSSETEAVVVWIDLVIEGKDTPYERIVKPGPSVFSPGDKSTSAIRTYTQVWFETTSGCQSTPFRHGV